MARDWKRTEVLRSLMTLMEHQLLSYAQVNELIDAYDEKSDALGALQLALDYQEREDPVTIREAMGEFMGGLPERRLPE
jgi:hypothetical protein